MSRGGVQVLDLTPPLPRPRVRLDAGAGPGRTRDTPRQGGGHAVPRGGTAGAPLGLRGRGAPEADRADVLLLEERLGGLRATRLDEFEGHLPELDALQDPRGWIATVEVMALLASAAAAVSVRTALGVEPPALGRRSVLSLATLHTSPMGLRLSSSDWLVDYSNKDHNHTA
jgi:hypothetical protein